MNWWKKLIEQIQNLLKPKPKPKPEPTEDGPESIHCASGTVLWKNLKVGCKILASSLDATGFTATYTENPTWSSKDGLTDGFICMVWIPKDKMEGEYWDCKAVRSPYKYVSLFHITDPSSPFAGKLPNFGDKVGMVFVSEDLNYRSDISWSTWPLRKVSMFRKFLGMFKKK